MRATAVLRRSAFVPAGLPSAPVRAGASASRRAVVTRAQFSEDANLELSGFGEHVFKGAVAGRFLGKYGETAALLDTPAWTKDKSDVVAAALLDWARENGASVYCHWFQPMGSSGYRHGQSGQVYNTMVEFDSNGVPRWKVRRGRRRDGSAIGGAALDPNCLRMRRCIAAHPARPAASGCAHRVDVWQQRAPAALRGRGTRCAGAWWLDHPGPVSYAFRALLRSSPARIC